MDGAHDMGGVQGFGPVRPQQNEPVFHAEWERRMMAMTIAMGKPGQWNIDMSRFARENRSPADYLSKSYYEIWLAGLETLLIDAGLATAEEIESGEAKLPARQVPVLAAADVAAMLRRGGPSARTVAQPARFSIGDRVRAKVMSPVTHTRLPRYVRGRVGIIGLLHGAHVFPDSNALGNGEAPQWLYTVAFCGRELWGDDGDPALTVSVDAWESYLEFGNEG
jgi:nitrile hydratase subunit beta